MLAHLRQHWKRFLEASSVPLVFALNRRPSQPIGWRAAVTTTYPYLRPIGVDFFSPSHSFFPDPLSAIPTPSDVTTCMLRAMRY